MKFVKWLLKQFSKEKLLELVFDLFYWLFESVAEFIADKVGEAELRYPGQGTGRDKFAWVWGEVVGKYPLLKGRRRALNFLIEWAVSQLDDGHQARNTIRIIREVE